MRQNFYDKTVRAYTMLSNGLTSKQVAEEMGISHRTVEKWVCDAKIIYDCRNTAHLVATLIRLNIIP